MTRKGAPIAGPYKSSDCNKRGKNGGGSEVGALLGDGERAIEPNSILRSLLFYLKLCELELLEVIV